MRFESLYDSESVRAGLVHSGQLGQRFQPVNLLHLPDKPTGVGGILWVHVPAKKLVHLPDEPAGVRIAFCRQSFNGADSVGSAFDRSHSVRTAQLPCLAVSRKLRSHDARVLTSDPSLSYWSLDAIETDPFARPQLRFCIFAACPPMVRIVPRRRLAAVGRIPARHRVA